MSFNPKKVVGDCDHIAICLSDLRVVAGGCLSSDTLTTLSAHKDLDIGSQTVSDQWADIPEYEPDLTYLSDEETGQIYSPADDSKPFDNHEEANKNFRYKPPVRNPTVEAAKLNVASQLQEVQRVMESAMSSDAERLDAIRTLQQQVEMMNQWGAYYSQRMAHLVNQNNRNANLTVSVNTLQAQEPEATTLRRSARNQQRQQVSQDMSQENSDISPHTVATEKGDLYCDYDKVLAADQEQKKRVRFEQDLQPRSRKNKINTLNQPKSQPEQSSTRQADTSSGESLEAGAGVDESQGEAKHAQRSANLHAQSAKQQQRTERAKAEIQRRGLQNAGDSSQSQEPQGTYELYQDESWSQNTDSGIKVFRDDQFTRTKAISEVNDYTLATFLMENRVCL